MLAKDASDGESRGKLASLPLSGSDLNARSRDVQRLLREGECVSPIHDGRLWSLWDLMTIIEVDMLAFVIDKLAVSQLATSPNPLMPDKCLALSEQVALDKAKEALGFCELFFIRVPIGKCWHYVDSAKFELQKPMISTTAASAVLSQLIGHIVEELKDRKFIKVCDDAESYVDNGKLLGDQVSKAFPSASAELREAGNCLAVECHTAAVFHLMRAVEHGLRALADAVGISSGGQVPISHEEWNPIIERIDKTWQKEVEGWSRSVELSNARAFFGRAVSDLKAFKDAVRNMTMHTRKSYNRHEALGVLNRVDGWFKTLAARVEEGMQGNLLERSRFKEDIP